MSPHRPFSHRALDESGFTMLMTLLVLVVCSLLMAAAFAAAEGDIHLTHTDQLEKQAYYAAEAGLNDYDYHLNADVNYWSRCTEVSSPDVVDNLGEKPLKTRAVPESPNESYAIQLIPAGSDPEAAPQKCDPANPVQTMIEGAKGGSASGTFRIQSTGYATNGNTTVKRTIVATFKHTSFLNYVYYTKYETPDPTTYSPSSKYKYYECEAYSTTRPSFCDNIDFISEDDIKGPMHSEDKIEMCGKPTFGRRESDALEFRGGAGQECSGTPNYLGTVVPPAAVVSIEPPPSNSSLQKVAEEGGYHYFGRTSIFLHGGTMDVTNGGTTTENVPFPENGVIYVSNSAKESCTTEYSPFNPTYTTDTACGNVYVHGSYTEPLTIASENDIVITNNITTPTNSEGVPDTSGVLGLIANNFVRVYHPIQGRTSSTDGTCGNPGSNATGSVSNIHIFAAILAVKHSFIVDNYDCGSPLESLNVYGAIAQIFRGTVGTHDEKGAISSGYKKNYEYDDRLEYDSPPYFLNPVKASWKIVRETLAPSP